MNRGSKFALFLVAVPVVVLLAALALYFVEDRRHAAAREAVALPRIPAPVASDDEAWALFAEAANTLDRELMFDELLEPVGRPAGDPLVWVRAERPLDRIDAMLARPGLSLPALEDATAGSVRMSAAVTLAMASAARGWSSDTPAEALPRFAVGIHLGQRFLDADGGILAAAVGNATREVAARELGEYLDQLPADAAATARVELSRALGAYLDRPSVLPRALATECAQTERLLDIAAAAGGALPPRWFFDRPLSIGWIRQHCQLQRAALDGGAWPAPLTPRTGVSPVVAWIHNPIGREAVEAAMVLSFEPFVAKERESLRALAKVVGRGTEARP